MSEAHDNKVHRTQRATPAWFWLGLAAMAFGVRTALFGPLLVTPSLSALFGDTSEAVFGPVPNTHVALEDPILLVAGVVFLLLACRAWFQASRRD